MDVDRGSGRGVGLDHQDVIAIADASLVFGVGAEEVGLAEFKMLHVDGVNAEAARGMLDDAVAFDGVSEVVPEDASFSHRCATVVDHLALNTGEGAVFIEQGILVNHDGRSFGHGFQGGEGLGIGEKRFVGSEVDGVAVIVFGAGFQVADGDGEIRAYDQHVVCEGVDEAFLFTDVDLHCLHRA